VLSIISPYRPLSTFLLVVRALGLYTPGPVRQDSILRPFALFLLRGIRQAAPAQVTACRVVTKGLQKKQVKLPLPLRFKGDFTQLES